MIAYSICPDAGTIKLASVPLGALTLEQSARFDRHEAVYVQSAERWIFGGEIATTAGVLPLNKLDLVAGVTPRDGTPGSCDVRWIEARAPGSADIIMRAVDVLAHGIEVSANLAAGMVG